MVYVRSHCDWPSDDEEGVGCSNWDSEGVGSCYSQHYKLERDDSKDAEKCEEYRNWMYWRDRSTNDGDDGADDGDKEEDLLDKKDYTW